jgi:hypothetical protein
VVKLISDWKREWDNTKNQAANQFICSCFRRCFAIAQDDEHIAFIAEIVNFFAVTPLALRYSNVLILNIVKSTELTDIKDMMLKNGLSDTDDILHKLNEGLALAETHYKGTDNAFSALLCDAFSHTMQTELGPIELLPTDETNEPWFISFIDCINTIWANNSAPVVVVCAIAFAKLLAKAVAKCILQNEHHNISFSVRQHLNSLLTSDTPAVVALRVFILKQLRLQLSTQQIRRRCESESFQNIFPWAAKFSWHKEQRSRLQLNLFLLYEKYSDVDEALANITQNSKLEPINAIRSKASSSKAYEKALLGAVAYNIYFARAARDLDLREQSVVDWLRGNLPAISSSKLLQQLESKCV